LVPPVGHSDLTEASRTQGLRWLTARVERLTGVGRLAGVVAGVAAGALVVAGTLAPAAEGRHASTNLSPQWTRDCRGHPVGASPGIYRALLNAGYADVKAVQRHATVLAAGLGPYGDPLGVDRMRPVAFMRELLCLSGKRLRRERCPHPAHFDAIDDHPYSALPTTHAGNGDDVSVPDLGRLTHVVTAALRRRTLLPRSHKAAWMTEIFGPRSRPTQLDCPLSSRRGGYRWRSMSCGAKASGICSGT
jgi:hypothetical protein